MKDVRNIFQIKLVTNGLVDQNELKNKTIYRFTIVLK